MHGMSLRLPSVFAALSLACCVQAATVRHYDAWIEPDIAARTLQGRVALQVVADDKPLQLDIGALQIDAVAAAGRALAYERSASRLAITLPAGEHRVEIRYHGAPTIGLRFLPQAQQVYTAFSTSQWLPCIDAPDVRSTLQLRLLLPAGLKVVASGELLASEPRDDGKAETTWAQTAPVPSYLFGFAAGPFTEVVDRSAKPVLRFLAPDTVSEAQLRQVFRETRHMIAFYERRAGLPYPGATYTQVLVGEPAAQEAAGFAVLGPGYAQRVLADETQVWLGAHELSHQWWGNAVTNRGWTEFWLNEGIASFMNAAWFEDRFGRGAYLEQIDAARASLDRLRAGGFDKPLVFSDWNRPTPQDRSLVYDKGAYAVHQLRQAMGDAAFWRGLAAYTREFWGRAVTSRDFQRAMQAATEQDLSPFFDTWVYRSKP